MLEMHILFQRISHNYCRTGMLYFTGSGPSPRVSFWWTQFLIWACLKLGIIDIYGDWKIEYRIPSGYSRRFATATARTASLGSHSRGIETKNIRKYWLSEKKREEFDGHV